MIDKGFLFQPDWEVRQQLRFKGGMPDLWQFDRIFVSCSGGKDSQAMSYLIANLAAAQNYPKERIELVYADTGLEWHDTFAHVQVIGKSLGIAAAKVLPKYKLLDNVRRRWLKFMGITLSEEGAEQSRAEQLGRIGRTEEKQARSRITSSDSATATTNGHPSASMCVFPSYRIMFCRSQGKQFPIDAHIRMFGGGGGQISQTVSLTICKILHLMGKTISANAARQILFQQAA